MLKKSIRKDLLEKRRLLCPQECEEKSRIIQSKVLESNEYNECDVLLCYSDFQNEVKTSAIINSALKSEKTVFLPTVISDDETCEMQFYKIVTDGCLKSGYFGIFEPVASKETEFVSKDYLDKKILMIVPGVGFDKKLNRLGFGKGFYDRYLSGKPEIFTLGICYDFQLLESLPVDSNDVSLNMIISEAHTIKES